MRTSRIKSVAKTKKEVGPLLNGVDDFQQQQIQIRLRCSMLFMPQASPTRSIPSLHLQAGFKDEKSEVVKEKSKIF